MWKDERNGLYGDYMRGRHLGGNPTRGNLAAIIAHAAEQATTSEEAAIDVADEETTPMPTTIPIEHHRRSSSITLPGSTTSPTSTIL